jgi:hypothetical protein
LNQTKNYISVAVKKEETAFQAQMEKVAVLVDIMEVEMEELEHLQRAVLIILLAVAEEVQHILHIHQTEGFWKIM